MIKELKLNNFGRFRDAAFDFKQVTLFFGYNESGKTTIFDALLDVICKPKGTTKYGKLLNARYTDTRDIQPVFDDDVISMSETDFINLFAIRSGTIEIPADSNTQWMNKVKASLFSGGLDPQTVVDKLDVMLTSYAKGSLRKEEGIISGEIQKYAEEKEKAELLKLRCIKEEKRIESLEKNLTYNTEEIFKLERLKEELEKTREQQNMIQEEKKINNLYADITQYRNIKNELEGYSGFTETILNELKEKEEEIQKFKIEAERISALEEESLRSLKSCSDEKAVCEKNNLREESIKNLAEHLRDNLTPREKFIRIKTKTVIRKPFIAAAGILFILGILSVIFAPKGIFFFIGYILASVICVIISISRKTSEDIYLLEEALKQARERWKNETHEDLGSKYEDALIILSRASERSRSAREKYEKIIEKYNSLEQERQERALQKKKANNVLEDAQQNLKKILNDTGSLNVNEYSGKLEKKKNLAERKNELLIKLNNAVKDYNAAASVELEGILTARLSELRARITEKELPSNEIKALENRLHEINSQLDSLHAKDKESIGSVNLDRGTVIGQYKGINEKIFELAKKLDEMNRRKDENKIEIRAAEIARDLFSSLQDDSNLMFERLSDEITQKFSALTTPEHKININSFNFEAADIMDIHGGNRNEADLSAGTRDAFLLAARLVLARKSRDNAIIILDDPFLTLDKSRTRRALTVLKEFHEDTKWQIILFTKDEDTVKQAHNVFGNEIKVHNL